MYRDEKAEGLYISFYLSIDLSMKIYRDEKTRLQRMILFRELFANVKCFVYLSLHQGECELLKETKKRRIFFKKFYFRW